MARQLVVVLGAGASNDCVPSGAPVPDSHKPPLVTELFLPRYQHTLNRYALALDVAAELRPLLAEPDEGSGALKIEDYLRDRFRDSSASHRRAQYWSVPLYLQDLLLQCGQQHTHPENFNRLVSALLHIERLTIVTLNYDTIFDRVLENHYALHNEADYVANPHFALVKLHGSVNWGRRVDLSGADHDPANDGYRTLCQELAAHPERLSADVEVLASPSDGLAADVEALRTLHGRYFYPAVSAPLGPNDEPTCPESHRVDLQNALPQQAYGYGLHLLVIGYSCLDKTPLDFIANSSNPIKSIVIVNGDADRGQAALTQLQEHLRAIAPFEGRDYVEVFNGGFSDFAHPRRLEQLVERIQAAD